jgi:hypothetical protein
VAGLFNFAIMENKEKLEVDIKNLSTPELSAMLKYARQEFKGYRNTEPLDKDRKIHHDRTRYWMWVANLIDNEIGQRIRVVFKEEYNLYK